MGKFISKLSINPCACMVDNKVTAIAVALVLIFAYKGPAQAPVMAQPNPNNKPS